MSTNHLIPFSFPRLPNVGCAFGTAIHEHGGEKDTKNRKNPAISRSTNFAARRELSQVHGTFVFFEPAEEDRMKEGDGLATSSAGEGLIIRTADCQPILAAHKSGKYVLALHCGWRGNRDGFPESGIRKFCAFYDLNPGDLMVVRGPSLGPGCSHFHDFDEHWPRSMRGYFHAPTGCMNLWHLTRDQLLQAGVQAKNIFSLDLCTMCLNSHFFSYRRDKDRRRMENIIWIKQ